VEIMPVRVGKIRDDFWPTMYANLAHQLGLKYCLVRAEGGRGTTAILPNAADLVECVTTVAASFNNLGRRTS